MNGIMPNPQYMPSPHGLAKRIRLHHSTDFYLDNSQDQHESFKEGLNKELFKTSHIYTGETKFTNQCLNFDLASSDDGYFDSVSSFLSEERQTVVGSSETYLKTRNATHGSDPCAFKTIDDDVSAKSVKHSEVHPQTDTHTESIESFVDVKNCSLVGGKSNTINVTSKKIEPKCDKELKVSDCFTSSRSHCKTTDVTPVKLEPKRDKELKVSDSFASSWSHCKAADVRPVKLEPTGSIGDLSIERTSDFVQGSHSKTTNVASTKHEQKGNIELAVIEKVSSNFEPKLNCKISNVSSVIPELNHDVELNYDDSTSDLVSRFQRKRQLKETPTEVLRESQEPKDSPNVLRPSVIVPNKLQICKPCFRDDEVKELEVETRPWARSSKLEENRTHKNVVDRRKGSSLNCEAGDNVKPDKGIPKTKKVLAEHSNLYGRIPRQTYSEIVKRLPHYKQFSNVFQKIAWNLKHQKNYSRIFSPVDSTQSKMLSKVITNTYKLKEIHDKNALKKRQLDVVKDMEELEDFLDYVSGKISELCLAIRSIRKDIQLLNVESEDISVPLHYIQNTHFINESDRVTSTRSEMLELGGNLLKKIDSVRQKCKDILKAYRHHLVIVSKSLYKLCSMPIEDKIIRERKTVFGFLDETEKLIETIEVSEQALEEQRDSNFAELLKLQTPLKKFHKLNSLFDELC